MDISIIICCYNSEQRIESTLNHLSKLKLNGNRCELILVDNNCNDNTTHSAVRTWTLLGEPFELKVYEEQKAGLSFAREKGVRNASGEFILFCDDDNWLDDEYIVHSVSAMRNNMDIGALCGRNEAVSDVDFPFWFTTYQKYFAVGVVDLMAGNVSHKGWLWGAGLVLRKNTLIQLWDSGFKHQTTDRKGNELTTGGDVELCKWILIIGKNLWYDDRLKLKHFIPKERLTLNYIEKLIYQNSQLETLFLSYNNLINMPSINMLLKEIILNLPAIITSMLKKNKFTNRHQFLIEYLKINLGFKCKGSFYGDLIINITNYKKLNAELD